MKLKDFNRLTNLPEIPENNVFGTFIERTQLDVKLEDVFLVNPVTILASKFSGFLPQYWKKYRNIWISNLMYPISIPPEVDIHAHNHFRAVALSILKKQGNSLENIKKMINIALGMPFTIVKGLATYEYFDNVFHIKQYPFEDRKFYYLYTINDYTAHPFLSELGIARDNGLSFESGTFLDFYTPLINNVVVLDYYENILEGDKFKFLRDIFDSDNKIPFVSNTGIPPNCLELDYLVNFKKFLVVFLRQDEFYSGHFDFNYFSKLMKEIIPKDVLFFFKVKEA